MPTNVNAQTSTRVASGPTTSRTKIIPHTGRESRWIGSANPPSWAPMASKGAEEYCMAISGGFLEVLPDRIIVLADSAERAEEIDIARAEEAKKRAQEKLAHSTSQGESATAEAALRRAIARIEVASNIKRRKKI